MNDGWELNHFERDVVRLTAFVIGTASLIGAAVGWVGHQLFEHLHHEGISDHAKPR